MSSTGLAPEIFKAYDIRGIVGQSLTNDTARSIGQALGSEALARKQTTIAVGRDALAVDHRRVERSRVSQEEVLCPARHEQVGRPVRQRVLVQRQRPQSSGLDLGVQLLRQPEDHPHPR